MPTLETTVIKYEHRQVTTQFLYLKIRRHLVWFNVDDKVDEKAVSKLTAVLRASRRHIVTAGAGFFTDVENSEKQELARAEDSKTLWKIVCANENDEKVFVTQNQKTATNLERAGTIR